MRSIKKLINSSSSARSQILLIIYLGLVMLITSNLEAATLQVPTQHRTIQEAINKASLGDTIIVSSGSYNENLVVTKSITLKSLKGAKLTTIKAITSALPVLKLDGTTKVTITGFTLTGSTNSGILLKNTTNSSIKNNQTTYNKYGIHLTSSHNNLLTKNNVNNNFDKGIFLNKSNNNKLIENEVNLNKSEGITLWTSDNNLIEKNNLHSNAYPIIISNSKGNNDIDNSTLPSINIILPIILIYLGVGLHLIAKKIITLKKVSQ